jgi:hypothetical protein
MGIGVPFVSSLRFDQRRTAANGPANGRTLEAHLRSKSLDNLICQTHSQATLQ